MLALRSLSATGADTPTWDQRLQANELGELPAASLSSASGFAETQHELLEENARLKIEHQALKEQLQKVSEQDVEIRRTDSELRRQDTELRRTVAGLQLMAVSSLDSGGKELPLGLDTAASQISSKVAEERWLTWAALGLMMVVFAYCCCGCSSIFSFAGRGNYDTLGFVDEKRRHCCRGTSSACCCCSWRICVFCVAVAGVTCVGGMYLWEQRVLQPMIAEVGVYSYILLAIATFLMILAYDAWMQIKELMQSATRSFKKEANTGIADDVASLFGLGGKVSRPRSRKSDFDF